MKNNLLKIAGLCLLATVVALTPAQTRAEEKPAAEKKQTQKVDRAIPFHGKIAAVNKSAKTLTVGERVFEINAQTRIMKDGKPATLDDATVGEQVGGSYTKSDDGKLTARSLRIGPKPAGEAKGDGKKKKAE